VAIPLTSEPAPPPAALIDGEQMQSVELRESDPELVALVRARRRTPRSREAWSPARKGRKGKQAEYRCAACGYGIVVYGQPPHCPMCSEPHWEHVEWRPFSQLLDFPLAPAASDVASTRLPSPTAEPGTRRRRARVRPLDERVRPRAAPRPRIATGRAPR
jgi:hypothetical protein